MFQYPKIPEGTNFKCQGIKLSAFDFESVRDGNYLSDTILDTFGLLMEDSNDKWLEVFLMKIQSTENVTFGVTSWLDELANSPI